MAHNHNARETHIHFHIHTDPISIRLDNTSVAGRLDTIQATLDNLVQGQQIMSDIKGDIANLQGDMTNLRELVPQMLDALKANHDAQGQAIESGDLGALAQLHTDFAAQLDAMRAAMPSSQNPGVDPANPGAGDPNDPNAPTA